MQNMAISRCCFVTGFCKQQRKNEINARALIGQPSMVYCASKLMEKSRVFGIITLEEFANQWPVARDLRILFVFYQHPAWFISL